MKFKLPVIASLVALGFAAPQGAPPSDVKLLNPANTQPTDSNTTEFDITIPASSDTGTQDTYITVRMWGYPQHIGQYNDRMIEGAITSGLNNLCDAVDECKPFWANFHSLTDVEYELPGRSPKVAFDGYVYITPEAWLWPAASNGGKAIMQALIAAVAYAYRVQTQQRQNCKQFHVGAPPDIRQFYHCQVGQNVEVATKAGTKSTGRDNTYMLRVSVDFEYKTSPRRHECGWKSSLDTIDRYIRDKIIPDFRDADPAGNFKDVNVGCR